MDVWNKFKDEILPKVVEDSKNLEKFYKIVDFNNDEEFHDIVKECCKGTDLYMVISIKTLGKLNGWYENQNFYLVEESYLKEIASIAVQKFRQDAETSIQRANIIESKYNGLS